MTTSTATPESQRQGAPPAITTSAVVLISAYIAAQMLADVGSLKIARLGALSVDGGTFIYPLTFTLRDLVHKSLGRKAAHAVIITAAAINLVMAGYLALVSALPADPEGALPAGAFALVLGPVWRIVSASILAEVVAELLDTEVYHLWVTRVTRRFQWSRVLVSNAVGIPIDSLIFVWAAFGGLVPTAVVWSIFWANVLIKGATTLVGLPAIYLVREYQPALRTPPEEEEENNE